MTNPSRQAGLGLLLISAPIAVLLYVTGWYSIHWALTLASIWAIAFAFGSLTVALTGYLNLATPVTGVAAGGSLIAAITDFHWIYVVHTVWWAGVFLRSFRLYSR